LVLAWLEEEGERRRRSLPLPPQVGDPAVRGWVHVGVCVLGGALAAVLFGLWLVTMSQRADQVMALEELWLNSGRPRS
jgi:hypothetical protein